MQCHRTSPFQKSQFLFYYCYFVCCPTKITCHLVKLIRWVLTWEGLWYLQLPLTLQFCVPRSPSLPLQMRRKTSDLPSLVANMYLNYREGKLEDIVFSILVCIPKRGKKFSKGLSALSTELI